MLVLASHIIKLDLEWNVYKIEHDSGMLKAKLSQWLRRRYGVEYCGQWMHAVKKVCVGKPLKTVTRGAGFSGSGWLDINHLVVGVIHSFHPQPWLGAVGIYTLSYPPQNSAKLILLVWFNPSAVRPHYKRNRWFGLFLEEVPAFLSRPLHCCGYVSARLCNAMLKLHLLFLLRSTSTKLCILQFSAVSFCFVPPTSKYLPDHRRLEIPQARFFP